MLALNQVTKGCYFQPTKLPNLFEREVTNVDRRQRGGCFVYFEACKLVESFRGHYYNDMSCNCTFILLSKFLTQQIHFQISNLKKYLTFRQGIKFKDVHHKVMKTKVIIMKLISPASFPLFMPLLPPFLRGVHGPCLLEVFFADYLNWKKKKSIAHSDK